jgi:lipoic acid synthetase
VSKGSASPVNPGEVDNICLAVKELNLHHVIITSVTRDDLPDGGASHFAAVIGRLESTGKQLTIEVLIPDFQGSRENLTTVVRAIPHIVNHNIETVPRLYRCVRPMANYRRSLDVLKTVKEIDNSVITKSGIMLGLGEREEEIFEVFDDLRDADCDLLTIGQYLAPSKQHHSVVEYVTPERFTALGEYALAMGFRHVSSGPLVRSSYSTPQCENSRRTNLQL